MILRFSNWTLSHLINGEKKEQVLICLAQNNQSLVKSITLVELQKKKSMVEKSFISNNQSGGISSTALIRKSTAEQKLYKDPNCVKLVGNNTNFWIC